MKKYWLAVLFLFSLTVNYATFVSNDKVNERIFQRELEYSLSIFFSFKDWTNWSSLEKDRRRAE